MRQTVLTTVRNVKYAYWNLKAAAAALQVARQSLDLARESLRNNKSRVEIGTMAPIDIVEAEAEVARRTENVIVAEAAVKRNEDRLRTLILDTKDADYWATHFDLTEQPPFEPTAVDVEQAVKTALEKRTDLQQSRKNIEIVEHQHPVPAQPDPAGPECAGRLRPQRAGRHEVELRAGLPAAGARRRSTKASAR